MVYLYNINYKIIIILFQIFFISACTVSQNFTLKKNILNAVILHDDESYIDGGINRTPNLNSVVDYFRLIEPVSATGWRNYIYIADVGHQAILRFDIMTKNISVFYSTEITSDTKLIANSYGSIYLADPANRRILYLDNSGYLIRMVADFNLVKPVALVEDMANARLLVMDSFNNHLLSFNHLGRLIEIIPLDLDSHKSVNNMVSFDIYKNKIYLLDQLNGSIFVTDHRGKFINRIAVEGLKEPVAISISHNGELFVSDSFDNTLYAFTVEQSSVLLSQTMPTKLLNISAMFLHESWLYVVDSASARIKLISTKP